MFGTDGFRSGFCSGDLLGRPLPRLIVKREAFRTQSRRLFSLLFLAVDNSVAVNTCIVSRDLLKG